MINPSSTTAPLFVVVGASGNQGGSTIRAIIASSKEYRVRAITRDTSSAAAESLRRLGCQVVKADMTVSEDLNQAFEGADYVYCMTVSEYGEEDAIEVVRISGQAGHS